MSRKSPPRKAGTAGTVVALVLGTAMLIAALVLLRGLLTSYGALRTETDKTPTPSPDTRSLLWVTPDPALPTPTPAPRLLKLGSEGEEVRLLQERLKTLGYYADAVDGQFGSGTRDAVIAFQRTNELDADGVAGPATRALLESGDAKPAQSETPTPAPTAAPAPAAPTGNASDGASSGTDDSDGAGGSDGGASGGTSGGAVASGGTSDTGASAGSDAVAAFAQSDPYLLLVNRDTPLPDGYAPNALVRMRDVCDSAIVYIKGSEIEGETTAVEHLMEMLRAAVADGVSDWQISAGYRSTAYQKQLFDAKVSAYVKDGKSRANAISATRRTVADPGTSEHHTGLAFDVTVPGVSFKGTKQALWLAAHCFDYGFILRYEEDKQEITGYVAEPWHIRYVGLPAATEIRDLGLCLEEYLDVLAIRAGA